MTQQAIISIDTTDAAMKDTVAMLDQQAETALRIMEQTIRAEIQRGQRMLAEIEAARKGESSMVWHGGTVFGSGVDTVRDQSARLAQISETYRMLLSLDRRQAAIAGQE